MAMDFDVEEAERLKATMSWSQLASHYGMRTQTLRARLRYAAVRRDPDKFRALVRRQLDNHAKRDAWAREVYGIGYWSLREVVNVTGEYPPTIEELGARRAA